MKPIIEFRNFSFQYRTQTEPSIQDINLKIYPGEKVLITGPSGCGKSTLAHCINALNPCSFSGKTDGTLIVDGKTPSQEGVFGMSKTVGTVLQDTSGQFIGLTVAEDLAFALENDAVPQKELFERVDRAAEIVGMTAFLKHSPTELSGGQMQRVSMGGVLVDDVSILLFDEPLANLDPMTGKTTIELIDEICHTQDVTVVIIEHRLEDVLYRDVDRIIVMEEGRIVADEHPDVLLSGDVLNKTGVREPLYVTAIKHAGGVIRPEDHPQHIETMQLEPYREAVRSWFSQAEAPASKKSGRPALALEHVSFSYEESEPVLKDVSLQIEQGEMLSIVGKNGAGKSTLASLIMGFLKPQSGTIRLNGEDISPLSVMERGEKIGLVMQSPHQMISKPMIYDEVALGLAVRGVPEDEIKERVHQVLKTCGLYQMRNWPVSALSFGQKKRVSIASILVMNPEIIILDEPTAGQDYRHYTEIMEFLKKLNEEMGLTIVMITHDMHLMLEYTDRAIVLADGEKLADDTPARVLTDESIADRAYLKKTSLYDLSVRCGISSPDEFVDRFIAYERAKGGDRI
ncbi:MAG: ABC transporter ATP-binding protein [Lachnospiraceae bacterium]|nr:ABC transporter ATP-binding protein [Lachnospiraceae bacterium]